LVVGTTSSAAALAILPVAQEFKKPLIVEPAVADSITGEHWNRYVFRTARNSGQDAIANALAVAKPGVSIATIAQDYAFGKDGVAAYKAAVEKLGGKVVHEEYAPVQATDFTAPIQKIPVNDWLVREHQKRFNEPPDFFTCGGFAAAMAVVAGIQKAAGTDAEKLIAAMESMEFQTPKGKMTFRKDDHQAMQSMYAFK